MKKIGVVIASAIICTCAASSAFAATIFADDFNRAASGTVGAPAGFPTFVWSESGNASIAVINFTGTAHDTGVLQLNGNGTSAVVNGSFSTVGFTNVKLSLDWAGDNIETGDVLTISWKPTASATFTTLTTLNGTGSVFTDGLVLSLGALAANTSIDIKISAGFDMGNDTYYIDNVSLTGDAAAVATTPIPGAAFLMGTVLAGGVGFGSYRRKRKSA
jgi:hypothetical protein